MTKEEAIINIRKLRDVNVRNSLGKSIEKILSMLKEKDEEIQLQKDINKTEQNRHKQTEKSLKGQLEKKNKIIKEIIRTWKQDDVRSIEELERYFERRAEND